MRRQHPSPGRNGGGTIARHAFSVDVLRERHYDPVCVKTGRPFDQWLKQTFTYTPRWTYLLLFLGILPFVIAALLARKQVTLEFPAVAGTRSRRVGLILAIAITGFLGASLLIGSLAGTGGGWAITGAVLIVATIVLSTAGMDRVWLRGQLSKDQATVTLRGTRGIHPARRRGTGSA